MAKASTNLLEVRYKTVRNVFYDVDNTTGHWSKVDLVVTEQGSEFAIKEVGNVEQEYQHLFWNEIDVLFNVLPTHPRICPLLGWFEKSEDHFGLVMPYIRNRQLSTGDLEIQCAKWYTEKVLSTLSIFHTNRLIFCNMKPENILVREDSDDICVIDFDCLIKDDGEQHIPLGSGFYEAPEQESGNYDYKADSFSMGMILAGMAMGDILFWDRVARYTAGQNIRKKVLEEFKEHIKKGNQYEGRSFWQTYKTQFYSSSHELVEQQETLKDYWVAELEDLVAKLTHYDPRERLSCADALNHPYFSLEAELL